MILVKLHLVLLWSALWINSNLAKYFHLVYRSNPQPQTRGKLSRSVIKRKGVYLGLDGVWGSKLGWKLSAERKSKGELILFWTIDITQDALEPVVEPPALYSRVRISLFCFQSRGYFPHILTSCFLPLKDELLQVLIFILGQNIAKQHSQSNDINGKREKLSDSSWAGSGRLTAMERTLHRQHWQSLCHTELQLGLCKSLAVLTKHPNSGSIPAPSESQISCCPSRDGVKPELCLQESHEPAEARHHGELAAPGDFPGKRGQGWPSGTADFPIPSRQEEQSGRATVSPRTLRLKAPLEGAILLPTPRKHREASGAASGPQLLQISGEGKMLPSSPGQAHRALQLNVSC